MPDAMDPRSYARHVVSVGANTPRSDGIVSDRTSRTGQLAERGHRVGGNRNLSGVVERADVGLRA